MRAVGLRGSRKVYNGVRHRPWPRNAAQLEVTHGQRFDDGCHRASRSAPDEHAVVVCATVIAVSYAAHICSTLIGSGNTWSMPETQRSTPNQQAWCATCASDAFSRSSYYSCCLGIPTTSTCPRLPASSYPYNCRALPTPSVNLSLHTRFITAHQTRP